MFIAGERQREIAAQGTESFMRTVERSASRTFRDRVANLFKARPMVWIDGLEIADIGGAYASRTRISECRRQLGMTIQNKLVRQPGGSVRSFYRFVPSEKPAQLEMSGEW